MDHVSNLRRRLLVAGVVLVNLTLLAVVFSPVWDHVDSFAHTPFGCLVVMFVVLLVVSQGALVAFWAAFGGGRSLWRSLAVVLGVIAHVWCREPPGIHFLQYILQDFAIELLGAVWGFLLVARLLGLGLVRTPNAPRTLQPLQFSIADMLLWTTALAVVLGLLRWLAFDWHWFLDDMIDREHWVISSPLALVALAAMFLALGRGRPLLRTLLLLLSIVAGVGMLDAHALLRGQRFSFQDLCADAIAVAVMAAWLVGSLGMIRLAGYRLAWQWRFKRRIRDKG